MPPKSTATIYDHAADPKYTPLVLVTGVSGFLASWIVKDLLEKGYRVRGTVRWKEAECTRRTRVTHMNQTGETHEPIRVVAALKRLFKVGEPIPDMYRMRGVESQDGLDVSPGVRNPKKLNLTNPLGDSAKPLHGTINPRHHGFSRKFEIVYNCDLVSTHVEQWYDVVKDCDYVIHCACPVFSEIPAHDQVFYDPAVRGTRKLLDACAMEGSKVKRFVYTSSIAAVYNGWLDLGSGVGAKVGEAVKAVKKATMAVKGSDTKASSSATASSPPSTSKVINKEERREILEKLNYRQNVKKYEAAKAALGIDKTKSDMHRKKGGPKQNRSAKQTNAGKQNSTKREVRVLVRQSTARVRFTPDTNDDSDDENSGGGNGVAASFKRGSAVVVQTSSGSSSSSKNAAATSPKGGFFRSMHSEDSFGEVDRSMLIPERDSGDLNAEVYSTIKNKNMFLPKKSGNMKASYVNFDADDAAAVGGEANAIYQGLLEDTVRGYDEKGNILAIRPNKLAIDVFAGSVNLHALGVKSIRGGIVSGSGRDGTESMDMGVERENTIDEDDFDRPDLDLKHYPKFTEVQKKKRTTFLFTAEDWSKLGDDDHFGNSSGSSNSVVPNENIGTITAQPLPIDVVCCQMRASLHKQALIGAYALAKTIAERVVWDFKNEHNSNCPFDVCTICPGTMTGPLLIPRLGESANQIKRLIEGTGVVYTGGENSHYSDYTKSYGSHGAATTFDPSKATKVAYGKLIGTSLVDVRDVAEAHVKCLRIRDAGGKRFLCVDSTQFVLIPKLMGWLECEFGPETWYGYPCGKYNVVWPGWKRFWWMANVFGCKNSKELLKKWNKELIFDTEETDEILKVNYRSVRNGVIEMARSLETFGLLDKGKRCPESAKNRRTIAPRSLDVGIVDGSMGLGVGGWRGE